MQFSSIRTRTLLSFMVVSCLFYRCKTTVETTPDVSFLSDEYYLQFNSLEAKMAQLMCGHFSCYRLGNGELFEVNEGKDSIVVYAVTVGDPNKDGTWVYKEGVLSNLPDKPLTQLFQKIEREAPDSLTIYEYRPKESSNPYIGYQNKARGERKIDIKDMVSTGCTAGVKKINPTTFECTIDMCRRDRGAEERWTDLTAIYDPSGISIRSVNYDIPDRQKSKGTNRSALFYRRLAALK